MNDFFNTPIEFLKGVGPERGAILRSEAGIHTFWDLLNYFPFRYIDRSIYHNIADIPHSDGPVQLKGVLVSMAESGVKRGKHLKAVFRDQTGSVELIWFKGIKWVRDGLKPGHVYRVYGKPGRYGANWNIAHPEMTPIERVTQEKGLQPIYPSGEKLTAKGLHSKGIEKLTQELVQQVTNKIPELFPNQVLEELALIPRESAYKILHVPSNEAAIQKASFRLKFEELMLLQLELLLRKHIAETKVKGFVFEEVGDAFTTFYEHYLPFQLTGAQKRVLKEIRADLKSGKHMNRLLQGDVGSGKTLVALLTMLFAVGNGFQAAIMAPTEILAQQHYETIAGLLESMDVNVALLTGSTKAKDRKPLHAALENGEIHVLIGTHALLEPKVIFKNLGIVVIDEQHRFGVAQRARLWKKNTIPPHILVMTATPIPRTLAMTFYGDLDVSVIDELPPGRKPIKTMHFYEEARLKVFDFMRKEIALGRQVYVVYPLIEESEKLDFQNLHSGYEAITREFPRPQYQVSIVHGKMKPEDKDFEMRQFAEGKTHIMVATTVIEVGVNVPNASVMIIESSERFGLSQLHQLRGRVGRGAEKSYCILMTGNKVSQEGKKRLETMVSTNDGFKISEVDLEIRGPGDIMGTQQSGLLNLRLADLARDGKIVSIARDTARALLNNDPDLKSPEHQALRQEMKRILTAKPNWGKIS